MHSYYLPNAKRSNLTILLGAEAKEIILRKQDDEGDWVARGLRFTHGGSIWEVLARCEVVVSAGSVQSPHLSPSARYGGLFHRRFGEKKRNPSPTRE